MKIGILFDLDGTLWDATESITDSWNDILEKRDYDFRLTKEQVVKEMGKVMEDIADSLFPMIEVPERYDLLQESLDYETEYLKEHGGILYDGVEDVLKKLSEKYQVIMVSNGQEDYIKTFIEYFDFGKYISDYEEAGRTGKPKADNIRLVMERNHLEKAFYVGDTLGDMNSTDEAGIPFIHAAYGFGTVPADRIKINDIKELPNLIDSLVEKQNSCEN